MSWHQIIITNPTMAQTAIADLLQQWHAVDEAAVYRDPTAADAIYYFSPAASILAKDILWVFGATVCPPLPNLDVIEKVESCGERQTMADDGGDDGTGDCRDTESQQRAQALPERFRGDSE